MENKKKFSVSLTTQILIATVGGIIFGSVVGEWATNLKFIGDIFIRLIQMSVVLLVMSAVAGAVGSGDGQDVGKMGFHTFKWIIGFTIISAGFGVALSMLLKPGVGISLAGAEQLAEQTFNPRLGIIGGISILGTSGIVEPMSAQALLDTIRVELNQKKAQGYEIAAVSPGNYGLDYMKRTYQYDLDQSVKCSNFVGDTIDMAIEIGFPKMLFTGHIGKLVKVAGGMMNTHSREGDCRMEILTAAAVKNQVPYAVLEDILQCVTTEEALRKLDACGKKEAVMQDLLKKICFYMNKRAAGKMQIEVILYSNDFGELAKSDGAESFLNTLKQGNLKNHNEQEVE